jgi:hypothetical protein
MNRKLGGKSGKLKCNCGKLRYERMELCPQCYYSKLRYYVYNGFITTQNGYDGGDFFYNKDIILLKGFNIDEALSSIDKFKNYGKHNQYFYGSYITKYNGKNDIGVCCDSMTYINEFGYYINGSITEFKTKNEAEKYIKSISNL